MSRLVGRRCETNVELEGSYTRCLLDSGSQVSTVSATHYNDHLACKFALHPVDSLITIEAANGLPIKYLGYVQVSINLASIVTTCRERKHVLMFVCPDTAYSRSVPIVLGTNVLDALCDSSDRHQGTPAVVSLLKSFQAVRALHNDEDGHVGKVTVCSRRAVVIQPGCTVSVRGKCHARQLGGSYPAVADGPANTPASRDGLAVVSSLVTVSEYSHSTVRVPVQNLTGHVMTIGARTHLADLFIPKWVRSVGCGGKSQPADITGMQSTVSAGGDIDTSHIDACRIEPQLTGEWAHRARDLLRQHADVFSRHDLDVGKTSMVRHKINLVDDTPFKERSRPISSRDLTDAREHIRALLDAGIIRESSSPYASPIVLVRKKNGSLRLTVDYRKLNQKTIKDAYALPRIDDAFSCLSGAKWFSVMDLKSGYYQVEMEPCDREKTAFVCPLGFYEYTRMPQGVTNAPATFQRLMERCVGSMNLQEVLAFLDDLIVFSQTLEEHETRLGQVFDRLRNFGLKLSPEKCSFFCKSVSYLGHIVSEDGIGCDPSKIEAVRDWPRPCNMRQLKSYLGYCGYYRRHIFAYGKISLPLTTLLKGYTRAGADKRLHTDAAAVRKPFGAAWTSECETAFQALKTNLMQAPVLAIADPALPYELHTDASGTGLGAALYQKRDGVLRPVAYASRGLSISESHYPAHKLEFLALRWAVCHKFHDFLYGSKFHVLTDNNPLTYVLTTARLDATGHRWLAALSAYDFDITYRAAQHNADADGLSRRPHEGHIEDPMRERQERHIASLLLNTRPQRQVDILDASAVVNAVLDGQAIPAAGGLPILDSAVLDQQPELEVSRMPSLTVAEQRDAQLSDPNIARVRQLLESTPMSQRELRAESREVAAMMRVASTMYFCNGILYKDSVLSSRRVRRLVVPFTLRQLVYQGIHDEVGHLGADRGVALARTRFYWFQMESDIRAYCKGCMPCILRKAPPQRAPMCSLESSGPMDLVCIDFLKLDTDSHNKSYVLVITDHFTRFARAVPMRNQTARGVAEVLWKEFFLDFGFPRRLHSDRGASFTGKLMRELAKQTGVRSSYTTSYHPEGNAVCERYNRTLISMIATLTEAHKQKWSEHVRYLSHAYNCTQHDATGFPPFYLMFLRYPRLKVDWLFANDSDQELPGLSSIQYVNELRERLTEAYALADKHARAQGQANKRRYDRRVRPSGLAIGGRVLIRNVAIHERRKLSNRWLPDVYVVLRQQGGEGSPVYVLKREDGKGGERTLHRNLLLNCDCLPLPEEPTYRTKPQRRTPRPRTQLSATEDPPSRPNWESTDSESSDEPINANPHNERHEASLECRDDDEDLPLARLRQYGTPPTTSDEGRSNDSGGRDGERPPRPRRRTKPPDKLEYYMPGRPAWQYQLCVTCGAPPTRGYRY